MGRPSRPVAGHVGSGKEVSGVDNQFSSCPAKPRIEYLEHKDRQQNGKLGRIEKKVDRILWAIIGGLGAVVLALLALVAGMVS